MKKLRRSARIADMTQYLLEKPHLLIPLTYFSERYGSAKSSISEDLQIIKEVFELEQLGELKTLPGAAGGVKYMPKVSMEQAKKWVEEIRVGLEDSSRILPGGYLYMSDYLHQPQIVNQLGKIFCSAYHGLDVDYVMTVETKGIPLAYATAQYLNVPIIIVRRDNRVTEGSVVSINYVSGSSKRIQTMSLSRRALPANAKVLIMDDFMKAGGTIRGMMDLLLEFQAEVVGTCVFVEAEHKEERLVDQVRSLIRIKHIDSTNKQITMETGSLFDNLE
ncbi:pur operon repressor [Bacillus horti]|uniref:Purine operon repressor n=1 Tax=Caldalkalibacillus horti TaxID=77523 RepID=A0ABT9W2U4_9BACI|nr:pur operon repressor [Bacillus horti]MDQ0167575.1 purine operon repressor [Bacillus horti]